MVPFPGREYGSAAVGIESLGVVISVIAADPKSYTELGRRGADLQPVKVAGDQSNNPGTNRLTRIGFHPEVDGELTRRVQAGRFGNLHVIVDPVETEGLTNAACSKGGSILERAIISPDRVQAIPFPTPPTDQPGRCRCAGRRRVHRQDRITAGSCPRSEEHT